MGGAVWAGFSLLKPDKAANKKSSPELSRQQVKACDILGVNDAKKVLGPAIEPADDGNAASSSSDDISVSRCAFIQKTTEGMNPIGQKQASLLVRAPRSDTGKRANEDVFSGSSKPAHVQEVGGFGEKAFWNPEFGQLNVLKNDAWYIVEVGTSIPSERKLDDATSLARSIL